MIASQSAARWPQEAPIRVFIADGHPLIRSGLRSCLAAEQSFQVVGEEGNGAQALLAIRSLRPQVAVLDIEMPGLSGIEITRKLKDEGAETAVLILSACIEDGIVETAISAGAAGYVVKGDSSRHLLEAIRATGRGESYISSRVGASVVRALRSGHCQTDCSLSPRERDVVRLLSEGLSSKLIASELGIAPKTVEGNRAAIMEKLDIHSVAGLVKYAIRNHLTSLDE